MHGGCRDFRGWRWCFAAFFFATLALGSENAQAQLLRRLRAPQPQIEAIAGQPYGVGRWVVQLPPGTNPALLGNNTFTLTDREGRVRFQAFQAEPIRTIAREFLGRPQLATVYFLFTGDGPLEMQLYAPTVTSTTVTPRSEPVDHARLLADWWIRYARQANQIDRPTDYPDMVDNYLLATLGRQLSLPPASQVPPPPLRTLADNLLGAVTGNPPIWPGAESGEDELDQQLGLLFGGDSLRSAMQTQVLMRRNDPPEAADEPLPTGPTAAVNVPETLGDVSVEPIALHVPPECFYVRFGTFTNYLWFRDTMDRWSNDLKNLFVRRGLDFGLTARTERQISLKESALAHVLGPAVIVDVAMIGTDTFFREGASFGMLFQARNNLGLSSDFVQQRAATLKREPNCTDQQVEIAGRKVSFLSTPDNRVRSFYAIDGDYHLVTNSRRLVERFFEVAESKNSLGSLQEFRFARSRMPLEKGDTVFAYLSGEFFRNLAGPRYQIEMFRRMRSAAEIDMALVARLAAQSEGNSITALDQLVAADYLPEGFATRADGSRLEQRDGVYADSLRGARGSFMPVPDVPLDRITASEARRYQQFVTWFQSRWTQLDPVVAQLRRTPGQTPGVDHIVVDLQLTPLAAQNYQLISTTLGPIAKQHLARVPGDILGLEIIFSGNLLATKGLAGPQGVYRFFAGVRDADPSVEVLGGGDGNAPAGQSRIMINGNPIDANRIGNALGAASGPLGPAGGAATLMLPPYYFGAYPTPAIFNWLGVGQVPLDAGGFGQSSSGLWQRREGRFTTASPSREVLETVTPQLRFVDAPRPAQAWLHAGDLSRSKLAPTINGLFYRAAKSAAAGNVRFLHALSTQLRVPADKCLAAAEQLADAHFLCPLGGEYQLANRVGGMPMWVSSSLPVDRMRLIDDLLEPPPADYRAPMLDWLRGLDMDLGLDQRTLSVHAEVDMQQAQNSAATRPPARTSAAKPPLPSRQPEPQLRGPANTPAVPKNSIPTGEELPAPSN